MPTFNIVQVAEPGSPVLRDTNGNPYTFDNGQTAATEAKRLAKQLGIKLSAKPVIDPRWRDREQRRFENGDYITLPWYSFDWWYEARTIHPEIDKLHFPHVSQKRGAMIAYTASEEDGSKDKQTLIKPSKYLERFCAKALSRYRLDPRGVAAKFAAQFAPVELKFAATAEAIQEVYEQGPESCMSHSIEDYASRHADIHPVTTYAAGDLQVAYLEAKTETDEDNEGGDTAILARTLVWPKKKTHSRIYGDYHRMVAALKAAGYAFGAPVGARLRRVPLPGHPDRFVAPYIDAGSSSGGGSLVVYDNGKHLIIGRKDSEKEYFACSLTEGITTRGTRGVRCSHCEEYTEPDSSYLVRLSCDAGDYRIVCHNCISDSDYYWSSTLDGNYYDYETCTPVEMDDGGRWNTEQFAERGAVCALSGRNCDKARMIRMHNGVMWSRESFRNRGFTCEGNGKNYPNSERVVTTRGAYFSREFAKAGHFQCEDCKRFDKTECRVEIDGVCTCQSCGSLRQQIMRPPQAAAGSPGLSMRPF